MSQQWNPHDRALRIVKSVVCHRVVVSYPYWIYVYIIFIKICQWWNTRILITTTILMYIDCIYKQVTQFQLFLDDSIHMLLMWAAWQHNANIWFLVQSIQVWIFAQVIVPAAQLWLGQPCPEWHQLLRNTTKSNRSLYHAEAQTKVISQVFKLQIFRDNFWHDQKCPLPLTTCMWFLIIGKATDHICALSHCKGSVRILISDKNLFPHWFWQDI